MNIEGNIYITYLESIGVHRVVGVRPVSKPRKERDKKGKNGRNSAYNGTISFNECLIQKVEDLNPAKDCEDNRPKRLLK